MSSKLPFDLDTVVHLAQSRRQQLLGCQVEGKPLCGSFNRVVILRFDDGLKWVFRTPRREKTGQNLPTSLLSKLIISEVATLNFLASHSKIPVPRVIDHDSTGSNIVGVPYILMTCATGVSLSAHLRRHNEAGVTDLSPLTTKLMKQLGKICFELSELRFSEIGSIVGDEGLFGVRESLMPTLLFQDRHRLVQVRRGPFLTEHAYYTALNEAFLGHSSDLSLSHHFFRGPFPDAADYPDSKTYEIVLDRWNDFMTVNDKIDCSDNRIQYHTAGKIVEEILPQFCPTENTGRGFPLGHVDLSSSNIFVDDDCNITCIIDWEFASTMPLAQLLIPPGIPNQRRKTTPEDAAAFRAGFDEGSGGTMVLPVTPHILTDVLWHYQRWINLDTHHDFQHFQVLFKLHRAFIGRDPLQVIDELQNRPDILEAARRLRAGDREAVEIESDEDTYFAVTDEGDKQRYIAQKLTDKFLLTRRLLEPAFWIASVHEDADSEYVSSTELSE